VFSSDILLISRMFRSLASLEEDGVMRADDQKGEDADCQSWAV